MQFRIALAPLLLVACSSPAPGDPLGSHEDAPQEAISPPEGGEVDGGKKDVPEAPTEAGDAGPDVVPDAPPPPQEVGDTAPEALPDAPAGVVKCQEQTREPDGGLVYGLTYECGGGVAPTAGGTIDWTYAGAGQTCGEGNYAAPAAPCDPGLPCVVTWVGHTADGGTVYTTKTGFCVP